MTVSLQYILYIMSLLDLNVCPIYWLFIDICLLVSTVAQEESSAFGRKVFSEKSGARFRVRAFLHYLRTLCLAQHRYNIKGGYMHIYFFDDSSPV